MTGAAVRVGEAIARRLDAAGYRVWLHHFQSVDQVAKLASSLSNIVGTPRADLGDRAQRDALIRTVTRRDGPAAGRLDLLVNSAASFERGAFLDRSDADMARVFELVLTAPLSLARSAHPALAAASGCVVNIGDLLARHPSPGHAEHAIAKAGLEAATRALAVEFSPVRVCAVIPGTVAWPPELPAEARRAIVAQTALGRLATPSDVADAVLFLAQASAVTGETLVVDAGQSAGTGRRPL